MSEFGPRTNVPFHIPEVITERYRRELPQGFFVGDYDLVSFIGKGGMGFVYKAHNRDSGEPVAVKVSRDNKNHIFLPEGNMHALVTGTPHVTPLIEFGTGDVDGTPRQYVVTPYRNGGDLRSFLQYGALPLDQVVSFTSDLAQGVQGVHQLGVVHTEVKPPNILLTNGAELTDFGGALRYQPGVFLSETRSHTHAYGAPEALRGAGITPAFDVFSLGLTTAEMLLGRKLFQTSDGITHGVMSEDAYTTDVAAKITPLNRRGRGAFVDPIKQALLWEPAQRPDALAYGAEVTARYQELLAAGPDRGRVFFTAARRIRQALG